MIITIKHPVMAGRETVVQETMARPDEVRLNRGDEAIHLFYRRERERRWVCAVAKRLGGDGFLITTYPTVAVKEGMRVWPG